MIFSVFIILEIIIAVKAWPCVSQIGKVYSRVNSSAVLQFSADLTSLPSQFEVMFYDGSLRARISYDTDKSFRSQSLPGVSITGDTAGNVVVTLDNVQQNNAGIYIFISAGVATRCNCLYMLGTPVKPTLTVNKTPSVGESVALTCSSTSTTTPSNHSLSLIYDWRVDDNENPGGTKYSYTSKRHKLAVKNIIKEDANRQFTCTATEDVTDGYTSINSNQLSFDVYYGPDNLQFTPSETSYEKVENDYLTPVTCTATCYPECSFTWTKIQGNIVVSSTALLNLERLQSSDAGTYRCTATRTDGHSQSKDLTVNVIYGPKSMSFTPSATTYRRDENSDLPAITCNAQCYQCSFRWTGPNSFNQSGQVLKVNNLQKSKAGSYTCSATNIRSQQLPEKNKDVLIEVRYGPDLISFTPGNTSYIVDEGTTFGNIKCKADCFPSCTYIWKKDGQATVESNTDTLPLGTIQKSFDGRYTCRATNGDKASKFREKHVTIRVRYGPYQSTTKLTPDSEHYTINDGSRLHNINCSADCYPDCSYTWIKTKQGLNSTFSRSGILSLGTINPDDAGTYICLATNPAKLMTQTTSKQVTVKVQYGPNTISINKQSPYYIKEGDTDVVIECSSDCYPECSYEWTNVTSGSPITTNRNLTIQMVDRFMTSHYNCSSRNSARNFTKSSTGTINVIVQYAPDVSVNYSSSNAIEGQNFTLSCIGSGVPSNYTYTDLTQKWGNIQIPNRNIKKGGSQKFRSIHFSSLGLEDSGTYTCTLNNGIIGLGGKLNQTGSTFLRVEGEPKVLTEELRFTGATGETAKMQISIYSYPSLVTLNFTRNDGNALSYDYNITEHNVKTLFYGRSVSLNGSVIYLMISNLTESDFGNYTLELQNGIGRTMVQAFIKAKGKPHSPKHFEYLSEYGIPAFQWQKDFDGGLTQNFVIETSFAETGSWTSQINIVETDAQFKINNSFYVANFTGLSAGIYDARIFANNSEGASDFVYLDNPFEIKNQEASPQNLFPIPAVVGGVSSAIVVIIAVGIVVLFLKRRRKLDGSRSKLNAGNNQDDEEEEDEVNTVNPMYVSADEMQPCPADNTYAMPIKKKKGTEVSDVYAMVDKKKKKGIKGLNSHRNKKSKNDNGEVYENVAEVSKEKNKKKNKERKGAYEENPYENPEPAPTSNRFVNKDGLIYADLTFNDQPKGQKKLVIHGLDSMTEYVEVDFTKKADPLPDSDEEENKQ